MKRIYMVFFLILLLFPEYLPAQKTLRVAAVQFSIQIEDLRSFAAYRKRISAVVERSLAYEPDLIVFPEYTAAFIALIPYYRYIRQSSSIMEAFFSIAREEPLVRSLRDLFLLNSGLVERTLEEIFGNLARRHSLAILGGTYFAWTRSRTGEVQLRNRAFIYGENGRLLYSQDKVYLTDFESALLNLSPGTLQAVRAVSIAGRQVSLTICRDTFFEIWEETNAGSDLWIDIKANGTAFTSEEQERFRRALPARIAAGSVPFGLTVSLTGRFLDLFWEGESSLVQKENEDVRYLQVADSPREEEILFFELENR